MVDCNDELTDMLGNRMTSSEFNDQYNSTIEELTQDSLNDMNIDDPSSDEWNEEYEIQKDTFMDDNKIVLCD